MKQREIYSCTCCTALVEVLLSEDCDCCPECCGKPMEKLEEKTADAATEKHVPVIEKVEGGYKVTVGSVPHPMADDHYIQFIELTIGDRVFHQALKPGDAPEACFCACPCTDDCSISAREYCNKHGLWAS